MNIFLRGAIGAGKSTLLDQIALSLLNARQGALCGFMSHRDADGCIYISPAALPRDHSRSRLLADAAHSIVPGVFDSYGVSLLQPASPKDLVVMDELGFFEQDATLFQDAVLAMLNAPNDVVGVLKEREVPWYNRITTRGDVQIYDVTRESRDTLIKTILKQKNDG